MVDISRGFAARDGSAAKSHSTTTQYHQLHRLYATKHVLSKRLALTRPASLLVSKGLKNKGPGAER